MKEKDKKEFRENVDFQSDLDEESEERLDKDFEKLPMASPIPEDSVQLLHARSIPDGRDDFPRLINRNTTLANYQDKRPDPEYNALLVETSTAVRGVFVQEVEELILDKNNNPIPIHEKEPVFKDGVLIGWRLKRDSEGKPIILDYEKTVSKVFDNNFQIICDILDARHMFEEASSRAMGKNPENMLSRTNIVAKSIEKNNSSNQRRF